MSRASLRLAEQWEEAVNAADADRLLRLVSEDVVIVGPRGRAVGREVLRQWLDRARLRTETLETYADEEVVVVSQRATWHSESGAPIDSATIASRFALSGALITEHERYDRLDEALEAAGLTEEDRTRPDG